MKKVTSEHAKGFIFILAEILIGTLLLIKPVGFTTGIIMGVGVVLMAGAVRSIIHYVRSSRQDAIKEQSLTKGLLLLLVGWFCTFHSGWFIITFPALTIIYGVSMLASSLAKIQATVDMFRIKNKHWFLYGISALVSFVCAFIIINNPFTTTAVLWMFAGISLIAEGILDAVSMIFGGTDEAA